MDDDDAVDKVNILNPQILNPFSMTKSSQNYFIDVDKCIDVINFHSNSIKELV